MIETRPLNAATLLIVVGGTADREVALGVQRAILQGVQAGRTSAIVDLSEVEFVDSTALGVLLEARSKIGRDGLLLAAPQAETRRALQVSGLDRHLAVHDSVDGALAGSP